MISTRQRGNRGENAVCKYLETEYGYDTYPSRGSRGIDVVALPNDFEGEYGPYNLPELGVEVGTRSKSVAEAFRKIYSKKQRPGMAMMVVRRIKVKGKYKLRWHVESGKHGHDDFMAAIEAWRDI